MSRKTLGSKLAEPYASALLEIAKSTDSVNIILCDISDLISLLKYSPDLRRYLANPTITKEKKKGLLKTWTRPGWLNPVTLPFLYYLIDRGRIAYLDVIGEKFIKLVWEFQRIKLVRLKTVVPLSYDQEAYLIAKIKEVTGFKEIQIVRQVDKDILGGMILQMDSKIIDMSLKGKLRQIATLLGIKPKITPAIEKNKEN